MQYRTNSMAEGTFYTYLFEKNLQGDIIAVYNTSGTKLVSYVYDAWGNFRQTNHNISGTNAGAQYNPFTYRGYFYDTELGLYYLQSRYYDPFYGRFINADNVLYTGNDFIGLNLYSYCGNNPVDRIDDEGHGWWIAASAIVGGLIGGISKIVTNVVTNQKWNQGVIGAIAGGAVYGAVIASTGNIAAAAFSSAAVETTVNEITSYCPVIADINGTSQKDLTVENVTQSVEKVISDTVVNGSLYTITGKIASKIVPTNSGWFKPKKFISSFAGRYAVKSELQTIIQGAINVVVGSIQTSGAQNDGILIMP